MGTCFAFVDGTIRKIARPKYGQESLYNGWTRKRCHSLKYQAIVTPDRIIIHFYGPVEGTKHDAAIWQESGMADILERHGHAPDGTGLQIYGDLAYGLNEYMISPF